MTLTIRNARVVSLAEGPRSPRGRRGEAMEELSVLAAADVVIEGTVIKSVRRKPDRQGGLRSAGAPAARPAGPLLPSGPVTVTRDGDDTEIDAAGRALLPGLVDCHTHTCWAGQRLDEWEMKRKGVPYLKILEKGGGIMSTVRAVRAASQHQLTDLMLPRLHEMLRLGTTTVEVKSGYGLTTADELKMLHAIRDAQAHWPGTIRMTALVGHAIDDTQPGFVGRVLRETLPAIAAEFPGMAVDAFCETGAWSVEQCVLLLNRAHELHLPCRLHADQFNSLGMLPAALRLNVRSIDHLEATTKEDLELLAKSDAFGVMLPACGFHMDNRYARGRRFVMDGGGLCIASNLNPGSAPCGSMPFIIALAVRHLGLSPAEAITAATINPLALLGLSDRGTIAAGQRADLILLKEADERAIAFEFGGNPIHTVVVGGKAV